MAEARLAQASRRLRQLRRRNVSPLSEPDINTLVRPDELGQSDEVHDFLEFSRCFAFRGLDVNRLKGPLVYVVMRRDVTLYVGQSAVGARRPFDPGHHALRDLEDDDKLLLWPVANAVQAQAMEAELIRRLRPTWNQRSGVVRSS